MNRKFVRIFALMATVGFGACGDGTDILAGDLTEAEAQQLAGVLMSATFSSSASVPTQPAATAGGPLMTPFTFAAEIETTVQCPGGGSVDVAASVEVEGDDQTNAASIQYQQTQRHNACVATSDEGKTFTLWGNPSMNAAFTVDTNGQGVVEWAGSIEGIIDWESAGMEGTCSVDLAFSGRSEADVSAAADLLGTVCGFSIEQSLTIG